MTRPASWILCSALLLGCGSVTSSDDDPGDGGAGADAGDDAPNQPPTGIELSASSVEEQAAPGTLVGDLSAVDPDDDTHTFELVDGAGGLFSIDGTRLEVAPDAIPNYEVAAQLTVMVKATDGDGASFEESFAVDILDLREVVNTLDSGEGSLR